MDKRIKKTRMNILNVFMQLLEEKGINDITAQEIAAMADISRSTFYQHYEDVYHLLDQVEDEIFTEIYNLLADYTYEMVKADPLRLFTELFFYFGRNSKICTVLLNKNGSITTGQRISKMLQKKFRYEWEALIHCGDETAARYLSQYVIAGFVGILQEWIAGGMKETEEEMALIVRVFINNSVSQDFQSQYHQMKEANTEMSAFKEKIRGDARTFAGGVLSDTSGLVNEKSAEIQKKVEDGLYRASSRLAQKGEGLQTGQMQSEAELQRKQQKLQKKRSELEEKFAEKVEKLTQEGKTGKIQEERDKYQEELEKLNKRLSEVEAALS